MERDAAGNWSDAGSLTVTVDSGRPCSLASSPDLHNEPGEAITVTYTFDDIFADGTCDPGTSSDGSGLQQVELFVKGPNDSDYVPAGIVHSGADIGNSFSYMPDTEGEYSFYTIAMDRAGNLETSYAVADATTIYTTDFSGYALIIVGANALMENEGLESHTLTANNVYRHLIDRNFALGDFNDPLDHIKYFNPSDYEVPGTDSITGDYFGSISDAFHNWLPEKLSQIAGPVYIVLIGHGAPDQFYLANYDSLYAAALGTWLDELEAEIYANDPDFDYPIVVVLGSCYSGSMIDELTREGGNRVIISSTSSDEKSYRGPYDPDSVQDGEFFVSSLFNEWANNDNAGNGISLKQAFVTAVQQTKIKTEDNQQEISEPYFDQARQHPRLDDNGVSDDENEINYGSHTLIVGQDGDRSSALVLGNGADSLPPLRVTETGQEPTMTLAGSASSATLWCNVNDRNRASRVWVEIRRPQVITVDAGTQVSEIVTRRNLTWNETDNRYQVVYYGFSDSGTYTVFYYVKDNNGIISPAAKSLIFKAKDDNSAPAAFNLLSPASGTYVDKVTGLNAVWEEAADEDGVIYDLEIFGVTDPSYYYHKPGIKTPFSKIGTEAELQNEHTYQWNVTAYDEYGAATTSNQTNWQFYIDPANNFDGTIWGYVTDSATGGYIDKCSLNYSDSALYEPESQPQGAYIIYGPPRISPLYSVIISAAGYAPKKLLLNFNESVQEIHVKLDAQVELPGDVNSDGSVDANDIKDFAGGLGSQGCSDCGADLDNDGDIDGADIAKLIAEL